MDVSNIEIDHLEITGAIDWNVINAVIFIGAKTSGISGINIHDILSIATGGDEVDVYIDAQQMSNLVFSKVDANNPDGFGFIIMADGLNSMVTNVTFYKCSVENAGVAHGTSNTWCTGFDFADLCSGNQLTVSNLYAINCSVNGAWESGFHMEGGSLIKQNFVITGCNAQNCGQKPNFEYGAGYLINGDTVEYNNSASNNRGPDLLLWDAPITPIQNGISPPNSTKAATAVNQGNCSGVIITIDPTHKELVLYSNDGNPVSQQLELGRNYVSADGNNYSFNGTKLIAQFTNYAIMNLVASTTTGASGTGVSLGHNSGATSDGGGDYGLIILNQTGYTGVSNTGVSMSALVSNSDSTNTHNVLLGMYTKSGSTYTLVANTGSINVAAGATEAWVSGNFVTQPSLSSATTYYLGFETNSNAINFYGDSGGGGYITSFAAQSFGTFPSTITSPANWGGYQYGLLVN
jgi:hypothetical protein